MKTIDQTEFRDWLLSLGVDKVGFARIGDRAPHLAETWPEMPTDLPVTVSFGIALNHDVVDRLLENPDPETCALYQDVCYQAVNRRLDEIGVAVAAQLESAGFRAAPISATGKVGPEALLGYFSHKLAARLAGLGWIGKNCMMITPEFGPRIRWGTVFTDAPLRAEREPLEVRCGSCRDCVEICPPHAFTGVPFHPEEPVAVRFDVRKCRDRLMATGTCGRCLAVCPYGRRKREGAATGSAG